MTNPNNLAPVSIVDQGNLIKAACDDFCKTWGGTSKLLANQAHVWEDLLTFSDKSRLLITFVGEDVRGGDLAYRWHRVDRTWNVVVVRGHGWKNVAFEKLGDAEAFYTVITALREKLRSILNISNEYPVDYQSTRPLPSIAPSDKGNVFIDAVVIEFKTANDIPYVSKKPANQS